MLSLTEPSALAPCPTPFNLAAHVLARAADLPDKLALEILRADGDERWTYAQLDRAVRGIAGGLLAHGLVPGDRILLRLGNSVEFPLAFLGAVAAGLLPVACPAGLSAVEVTNMVAQLRPALIIAAPGISLPDATIPVMSSNALMALSDTAPLPYQMGDPHRPAYLIYTSGTSGTPRAVVHAHRAIWARRMMVGGWHGICEADRVLHAGAFNWTFTLGTGLFDPWAAGATALVPEAGGVPGDLPALLRRAQITVFAAAPAVYRQLLKHYTALPLPKLRLGLAAGEKLPDVTRKTWETATGTPIHEAFGLSECSTFLSSSPTKPAPQGATGYAQPGRRIAVLGEGGQPVARGESGSLAIHRSDPGLFLGYFAAAEETKQRFFGDWFQTGDTVRMADDGAIHYLGRDDDMMNAGGFRVSPLEVEAALGSCPEVGDIAVVELRRDAEVSFIAAIYTGPVTPAALAAHAATCLARYKQPREFLRADQLPLNVNGKINRRALREKWETNN